jgi:GNAT superfamily N-acetyltransferase
MKGQGKQPYNMYETAPTELGRYLSSEKCMILKAVDEATGTVVGFSCWGFRGFEAAEIPRLDLGQPRENDMSRPVFKDEMMQIRRRRKGRRRRGDSVKRLEAMTDADMKKWMETLMPPGTKCVFVCSLSVAPKFQARGVGSALLRWGTDTADRFGVFIWVHSSESAWTTYAKHDFEIVGTLDVDLDDWAPKSPPKRRGTWCYLGSLYLPLYDATSESKRLIKHDHKVVLFISPYV